MNRRKIFAWIAGLFGAGVASAQDKTVFQLPTGMVSGGSGKCWAFINGKKENVDCYPIGWQNGKAKNGECPVCGTMAENVQSMPMATFLTADREAESNEAWLKMYYRRYPIRCATCNAAFFRDAE